MTCPAYILEVILYVHMFIVFILFFLTAVTCLGEACLNTLYCCFRLSKEMQNKASTGGFLNRKVTLQKYPCLQTESHTITSTCSFHFESIEKGLDGLAQPSPPCLGPDVALIAGGNGGPLRRQQGLLSALETSPWEMITLL